MLHCGHSFFAPLKGKGENKSNQLVHSRIQNQNKIELASAERRENNQLGNVALMYRQILKTHFKRNL